MFLCTPALLFHQQLPYEYPDDKLCQCKFNDKRFNHSLYQLTFFILSFVLPITIIFALYLFMLKRLWFGNFPGGQMSSESVRSKVNHSLAPVIDSLFWCFFPEKSDATSCRRSSGLCWLLVSYSNCSAPQDVQCVHHFRGFDRHCSPGDSDHGSYFGVHELLSQSHSLCLFVRKFPKGVPQSDRLLVKTGRTDAGDNDRFSRSSE